jgi:hypothetical protein
MDIRNTLSANETFLQMLTDCKEHKIKVAMILDAEGMVREEGWIKDIHPEATPPYLELESGATVLLKTVIAVNGVFSPAYSEC